ncbi:hypothetical protein HGH93_20660 [Chitinophaga polysaccharea]|uniref:glycerophosphodiester phosphodiesterase n=1 Tax=Chitinophaga polysaccharea TaxID=1293035 RepID=UPI0014553D80|nr:glycerophosphodiester phosphodiesterase family protein [Chitinophaga polysaccharea]NLR60533.1 hypothetical protein [Chitinophaga polysaccharea]
MKRPIIWLLTGCLLLTGYLVQAQSSTGPYRLIAHRGGVVDSTTDQNSAQALSKAISDGYWMVEIDMRMTKDSVLITHHDATFKRSFGLDAAVADMNWEAIARLKNDHGYRVQKLEEVFARCKGKLGVMLDNKLPGNDTTVWRKLIMLLKKYDLYQSALMIGTDESTAFFTSKIKLSCTRQQLEENMHKHGFRPENYYLFSDNITKADADWAAKHRILVIGVINAFTFKAGEQVTNGPASQASRLKNAGVRNFQVDSQYRPLFGR